MLGSVGQEIVTDPGRLVAARANQHDVSNGERALHQRNAPFWVIACGPLVHNAILAAAGLEKERVGVRVINSPSVKPLDEALILQSARETGALVTVEEHQINGGLGSAISELVARNFPVPIEFIGVQNRFGGSGAPNELIEHFGMGVSHIADAVRNVLTRKKSA